MPVKIPTYESRLTPSGLQTQRASGNETTDALGRSLQNVGNSIAGLEDAWRAKENADAISAVGNKLAEADAVWPEKVRTLAESSTNGGIVQDKDGNNVRMTDAVKGEFSKWREDFLGGIDNRKARLYAEQHLNSLWSQTYNHSLQTEARLGYDNKVDNTKESVRQWSKLASENPDLSINLIGNAKLLIANIGLDEKTRNTLALAAENEINSAAALGKLQTDPEGLKGAIEQRFGGGGFDSIVDFTLKHEGGYKAADNNGAEVNFGINKKSNPDVDVKNLTREGAKQIYKDRYWKAIGGDELAAQNPALARAAFDTAVLSGPARAKEFLAKSGGDVQKFLDLREGYMASLSQKDPARYGGDVAKGWARRNADLRQVSAVDNAPMRSIVDRMTPEQAFHFSTQATTEMNRQQAVYRSQIATIEADHNAARARGEQVAVPLTESQYIKAYGPIEGPQRYAGYQSIAQFGADVNAMKLMPPEEMKALVERSKPGDAGYGFRPDGTPKGQGFLGPMKRPDGTTSTEISVGVNLGGKEMDIPLMVPGLSKSELTTLLALPLDDNFNKNLPKSILDKAVAHARQRMAEGKSVFAEAQPAAGQPGYAMAVDRYEKLASAADAIITARQADPMAYAIQNRIGDSHPLDFNNIGTLGQQLAQRVGVAQTMSERYQVPMSLLTKQEAATLNQGFQNMLYPQRLQYLEMLRTNVTNPQAYSSVLQQIAPDHPVVAAAGVLLNSKPFQVTTGLIFKDHTLYDPAKVARDMLYGEALLQPYKASKETDGIGKPFQMPTGPDDAAMNTKLVNEVGDAFADQPEAFKTVKQMARAHYAAQMARAGHFDGKYDSGVWKDSILSVTGGVADINGKKVVIPYGMGEDTFRSTLRTKFDEAMQARGMSYKFYNARFMNAGDGKFKVISATEAVRDKQGNPILIDMHAPPEPSRYQSAPDAPAVVTPDKLAAKPVQMPKKGR